jgi:hypothetical protein
MGVESAGKGGLAKGTERRTGKIGGRWLWVARATLAFRSTSACSSFLSVGEYPPQADYALSTSLSQTRDIESSKSDTVSHPYGFGLHIRRFDVAAAFCAREHDPAAQRQGLRALRSACPPFERFALVVAQFKRRCPGTGPCSHLCLPSLLTTMGTRLGGRKFLLANEFLTHVISGRGEGPPPGLPPARPLMS